MAEYIISKEDFELLQEDPAHYDSALKFARIYDLKHETIEEIIRCRDCKWYAEVPCEHDASFILYTCTRADFCMPSGGNGFCSWAERDDQ